MRKDYGMLGELGLEVGDVVERGGLEAVVQYGNAYGHYGNDLCAVDFQGFMLCEDMTKGYEYRVVSRASQKPEIKTGILTQKIGNVEVTPHGKVCMQHVSTSKELDAAIVTLQSISAKLKELNQ